VGNGGRDPAKSLRLSTVAHVLNLKHREIVEKEKTFALIRMETFSDGVLAVIITIMALELKVEVASQI
jgi:hypothetical protein